MKTLAGRLLVTGELAKAYDGWEYPADWVVETFEQEGPKILKQGDDHDMVLAEGGTAGPPTGHMVVVARSRTPAWFYDHSGRPAVLDIFREAARGVAAVQGSTGLWHQLLDRTASYLETSASATFTFALARGVNRGWLPPTCAPVAQAGWRALERRVRADGQIDGICVGTTAASDAAYYYNRPADLAAPQGYGPMLLAGAEIIVMVDGFDVERINDTFYYRPRK